MVKQHWLSRGILTCTVLAVMTPLLVNGGQGVVDSPKNEATRASGAAPTDPSGLLDRLAKTTSTGRIAIKGQRSTPDALRAAPSDPRLRGSITGTKPLKNKVAEEGTRIGQPAWSTGFNDIEVASKAPGGSVRSGLALQHSSKRLSFTDDSSNQSRIGDIFTSPLGR